MHYYNEIDKTAVAWLRNLIGAGLLPEGDVDERSIRDVQASDLAPYTQCHFFAGIGGWPLALALAGWPTTEPVWTGSCPCQPFSTAGRQGGEADRRHLWPEFQRLIAECRPATVFGEQVASKAGRAWLSGVRTDLEALEYGVGASDLCAASIGAPHIRQRLYWVGHSDGERRKGEPVRILKRRSQQASAKTTRPSTSNWLAHSDGYGAERRQPQYWAGGRVEPDSTQSGLAHSISEPVRAEPRGVGGTATTEPSQGVQRQRTGSYAGHSSAPSGLADTQRSGLMDATPRNGEHDAKGRPQWDAPLDQREPSQGRSDEGGMAHSYGVGSPSNARDYGEERSVSEAQCQPEHSASISGRGSTASPWRVAHADGKGQQGGIPRGTHQEGQDINRLAGRHGTASPWADSVSIPCLDGKERRTQSGVRPLADGVSGRVGQLRAYGNAIVPQVAAEFIMAYMEVMPMA